VGEVHEGNRNAARKRSARSCRKKNECGLRAPVASRADVGYASHRTSHADGGVGSSVDGTHSRCEVRRTSWHGRSPTNQNAAHILNVVEEFVTGARPSQPPDRFLATVLFTDIVDSTKLATKLGDAAWREVLDAHDQMIRSQLKRFQGREIATTGDGFLVTFDAPGRAIHCGKAIRDGARALDMEVRVGLHTGEVEARGADIGGITVHIGARVAAAAAAGEVLVSSTVSDLVTGSSIEFTDRGEHELKGVPGTWRLFSVSA
jgi:class 3 adenylate cyclase